MSDRSETMSEAMLERLAGLTPEKRELLRRRLGMSAGQQSAPSGEVIGRRKRVQGGEDGGVEMAALSFAQHRLWFLQQLDPQSSRFNLAAALRLEGRLDLRALERTIEEIIRRHESLRTTFALVSAQPLQRISHAVQFKLPLNDLSALTDSERRAEVARLERLETEQPFDLERGPLVRATLLRLRDDEHLLLWTMHHIISDGWSIGVLIREVGALYGAYIEGQGSPLIPLPIQYADYAVWQREWLTEAVLAEQLSYWRHRLGRSDGAVLELPTDRARPAIQTHRGAAHRFTLSPELSAELQKLSQQHGMTLFMTLLAAFQTLLYRYTGEEAISVGTPIANRTRREVEGLIGFFVNTLVMRTEMGGEPTFVELMGRVKEACLGAYAHQDVPFEKLVEELQPERRLSHPPYFQVWFVLQNTPMPALEMHGLRITRCDPEYDTVMFDVMLLLTETEAGLEVELRYSTDLFMPETMHEFLAYFQKILVEVVANPERRLLEIPLQDEEDDVQEMSEPDADADAEDQFLL